MRLLLVCLGTIAALTVVWVLAGGSVSRAIDRVYTRTVATPTLDRFAYDGGVLELGEWRMYLSAPDYTRPANGEIGADGRAVLRTTAGQSFALGSGHALPSLSGLPHFDFTPDDGDTVRFTVERSLLSWPTPFETNFMTGVTPSWARTAYCHLRWRKRGGAHLELLWRIEQVYYREGGWRPPEPIVAMEGLIRVVIG